MAGRPIKYTPERADKIIQAIRVGATFRLACQYAGISEDTFAIWRKRYSDFAERVMEAEGATAIGWLALINKAAPKDWQAALKLLERRYSGDYGRRTHITIDHDMQAEARRLAAEYGLDVDAVLAEAKAILTAAKQ